MLRRISYAICIIFALASLSLAQLAHTQTFGYDLINRQQTDTGVGQIFVMNQVPFTSAGTVTDWGFFNNNVGEAGRFITPLILERVTNGYKVRGVGTTRTNNASGVQNFNFDTTDGSSVVPAGYMFGWLGGSPTTFSNGTPEMDSFAGDTLDYLGQIGYQGASDTTVLGVVTANIPRTYSIQAHLLPAQISVPEPGAITLLTGIAFVGGSLLLRRRK
jgi:hypothetical protein